MRLQPWTHAITAGIVACTTARTLGDVAVYTDREAWEAAVGSFSTIDFTDLPGGTLVTDQYQPSHGVAFTGGFDYVEEGSGDDLFVLQSYTGIRGALDAPRTAVAVKFQDTVQIVLFCDGYESFYMSEHFEAGAGDFLGVVSTETFDAFVVRDENVPFSSARVDDLLLGDPAGGSPACANDPTIGSDLMAVDIPEMWAWGSLDGIVAFVLGSDYCNIGDAVEPVSPLNNEHPVFTTNMYRLMNGRFEQIGMGWVKHTWGADIAESCGSCQDPGTIQALGIGCSDVYDAGQNGSQAGENGMQGLGPRSDINPATGAFAFPYTTQGIEGDDLYKRLQVKHSDLLPSLNPGSMYFCEEHFIASRDAAAGNGHNNMCYAPVTVQESGEQAYISGPARPGQPPVAAWQEFQPSVTLRPLDIPDDGRLILAFDWTSNGDGTFHYEYALYNLDSHRAAASFELPIPAGAIITNIDFHDVDYHSGEIYDGTDWSSELAGGHLRWATQPYSENENANALRWATVYNFSFDADRPPALVAGNIGLFRPGDPGDVAVELAGPGVTTDCNDNGVPDHVDVADGTSPDCNGNLVPDECDLSDGTSADCNGNGLADECDIADGTSQDCNANGIPDSCDTAKGTSQDCNDNGVPDDCDVMLFDLDGNGIPDACEADCNDNGIVDEQDIADGISTDCNGNGVPDECDLAGGVIGQSGPLPIGATAQSFVMPEPPAALGDVTITLTARADLDAAAEHLLVFLNGQFLGFAFVAASSCPAMPDVHELVLTADAYNERVEGGDAQVNLVSSPGLDPAACDVSAAAVTVSYLTAGLSDCNGNGVPDGCDISSGASSDADGNGVPDECTCPDTDGNGVVDVDDLVNVVLDWGTEGSGHGGDVDGSGIVDSDDLVAVILRWGPC